MLEAIALSCAALIVISQQQTLQGVPVEAVHSVSNGDFCVILDPADLQDLVRALPEAGDATEAARAIEKYQSQVRTAFEPLAARIAATKDLPSAEQPPAIAKARFEGRGAIWDAIDQAQSTLMEALHATPAQRAMAVRRAVWRIGTVTDLVYWLRDPTDPVSAALYEALKANPEASVSLQAALEEYERVANTMRESHIAAARASIRGAPPPVDGHVGVYPPSARRGVLQSEERSRLNDAFLAAILPAADKAGCREKCLLWREQVFRKRGSSVLAPVNALRVADMAFEDSDAIDPTAYREVRLRCMERRDAAMQSLYRAYHEAAISMSEPERSGEQAARSAVARLESAAAAWEESERTTGRELRAQLRDQHGKAAAAIEKYLEGMEMLSWSYWRVVCDMMTSRLKSASGSFGPT